MYTSPPHPKKIKNILPNYIKKISSSRDVVPNNKKSQLYTSYLLKLIISALSSCMTPNIFNLCLTFYNTSIIPTTFSKQPGTNVRYYWVNHQNSLNVICYYRFLSFFKTFPTSEIKRTHIFWANLFAWSVSESPGGLLKTQFAGPTLSFWFSRSGIQPKNLYFEVSYQVILFLLSKKHTFRTTGIWYRLKGRSNQQQGGMEVDCWQLLGSSVLYI